MFPIKKVKTGVISYHPCLVNVKCWDSIALSEMKNAQDSMRDYVQKHRSKEDKSTTALCLLIVIGTSRVPRKSPESEESFPTEDTYISIVVPSRDKFEVNTTIQNMAGPSHISELLASHSFAFAEKSEDALRETAKEAYHRIGNKLLEDKHHLWETQK